MSGEWGLDRREDWRPCAILHLPRAKLQFKNKQNHQPPAPLDLGALPRFISSL